MAMDLNNVESIKANDPGKMLEALWNLPEQCQKALEIANGVTIPEDYYDFKQILVTGLGGSAIGGDLLRVFVGNQANIPVIVNRDYVLPHFVSDKTLVFATSYSGNTEETISAYSQARAKGAKIVCITTGGKLKELANADGVPVINIPGGISPRAATGFLLIPTIVILQKLALINDATVDINEVVVLTENIRRSLAPEMPEKENLAKQMAKRLYGKIPVIYGSSGTTEVIATRWKGQINENSKALAYYNVFPELNHNEIVGYEKPEVFLNNLMVVILRDKDDHERVQKRIDITKTIIDNVVNGIIEVTSQGNSFLARIFSLTFLGDYVSVYLACLYGVDPTPVKMIDLLKRKLVED
jgi:glucose/mannose-6-phosphate isomerase